ncbi:hypothetical protein I316_08040 [Kwoniella heveanensis BCC8398]|uniref:F-box domain-containing protein n=1 Tax=Kwoniella heveanensis BCC8398 TaxID=1296120 RepID=A0A1B9GH08_9TREE|nr:hypothetical protein I316_08040 [Kwoniella heveanensis BCC8398]
MSGVKGKSKAFTQNSELIASYVAFGKKALQDTDWAAARDNFDKAISFGGKHIDLLDLKVQALTELEEWHQTAHEIIKDIIQRWPDDHRGYERQGRLYAKVHYYGHAVKSISRAISVLRTQHQSQSRSSASSSTLSTSFSSSSASRTKAARIQQTLQRLNRYRTDLLYAQDEAEKRVARNSAEDKARLEQAKLQAKRSRMNFINRLSADVIITIAEQGLADHPGFAVKMAAVCKGWRDILLNQGSLWNKLVLGKTKPMERAKWCLNRTKGNIKELKITRDFTYTWNTDVAKLLEPSLKNITHLTIMVPDGPLLYRWAGKFERLEYLKIAIAGGRPMALYDIDKVGTGSSHTMSTPDLVCGLLGPETTTLRELDVEGIAIEHFHSISVRSSVGRQLGTSNQGLGQNGTQDGHHQPGSGPEWTFWTTNPRMHLGSLRKVHLKNCIVSCVWPDHSELLKHLPEIQSFTLENCRWHDDVVVQGLRQQWLVQRQGERMDIDLPNLKAYCVSGTARNLALNGIHAPNLEHLDLYRANLRGSSVVPHVLSPGLEHALPNLLSLDIGHCAITLTDMMDILPKLPQLQFLNVSYCSLDNAFLEALERQNNDKDLVPRLMALSIAGNTEITAGPLRRLVMSRTKEGIKGLPASSSATPSEVRRTGPFGPTLVRNSSPFAPSRPISQQRSKAAAVPAPNPPGSSSVTRSSKSPSAVTTPTTPAADTQDQAQPPSQATSTQPEKPALLPSIQWLNIDQCERIELEAVDILRKQCKVRFVSHAFGATIDDNRIRGKGRWRWDAEIEEGCGEEGCTLRRVPGECSVRFLGHRIQKDLHRCWLEPMLTG